MNFYTGSTKLCACMLWFISLLSSHMLLKLPTFIYRKLKNVCSFLYYFNLHNGQKHVCYNLTRRLVQPAQYRATLIFVRTPHLN